MKLILTDKLRDCPLSLLPGCSVVQVTHKSLEKYTDNPDVEVVICSRGTARLLQKYNFPNLKLVQLFSVGYDDVDLNWFSQRNIALCNASGVYDDVLAEYVLYAMLSIAKRFHRNISNRIFRPFRNYHYMTEISGKTIGIMGCGRIGCAVARHLSGFNVKIIGYAKNTIEKEGFDHIYHRNDLPDFVSQCDYLVNTLPDSEETRGLFDAGLLSCCKPDISIINIGRDTIYNGADFYMFLKNHKKTTAVLDMFELVPNPITNKYRRLHNVMVMPRVAAISKESEGKLKDLILDNISALQEGGQLTNCLTNG